MLGGKLARGRLDLRGIQIDQGEACAFAGEDAGGRPADAARGACDERGSAG
jgi:hypothetical protein